MKKEEIEQAAKEWSGFPEKDAYPYFDAFIFGANFVNERQPYTAEDIKSFLYWFVAVKGYHLNYRKYYRGDTIGFYTPDELIKNWKVWKEELK